MVDSDERSALERAKEASTLQLLFKAARLVEEQARARVAAMPGRPSLRPSHTALFPHLDFEGTRISTLAERLGITKQAVSQLVDDLEALGVVERRADRSDGRARLVRFTKRGLAGLFDGLRTLEAFERELEATVGTETMRGLREGLLSLLDAVREPPSGR